MSYNMEKSIFEQPKYQRSLLAFCDICYRVLDSKNDQCYRCRTCENSTMCHPCFNGKIDATHPLHHVLAIGSESHEDDSFDYHFGVFCRICYQNDFPGHRYKCKQCCFPSSYNVCSTCLPLTNSRHPKHTFAFVPNERKIHFNRLILAYRAMRLLKQRESKVGDRDELTGWTMFAAASIVATESLALQNLTLSVMPVSRAMAVFQPERTASLNRLGSNFANFMLQFYFDQLSTDPTAAIVDDSTDLTLGTASIPPPRSSTNIHRSSGGTTNNDSNVILQNMAREQDDNNQAQAKEVARYHRLRRKLCEEIHREVKRQDSVRPTEQLDEQRRRNEETPKRKRRNAQRRN